MVAAGATHHDAGGSVINVTLGEDPDTTTSRAGQRRGGDIESQHVREGTRGGVTVDVCRFSHDSFFLD
jgi:hypothetical protein